MEHIETSVEIAAPPSEVWEMLTSSERPWDPFIERIGGMLAEGNRLEVVFRRGMTFKPKVTEIDPGKTLEWLGKLGVSGVFDGRHRFELEPIDGGTRLRQSETFTGILVPLFARVIARTNRDFAAMNLALVNEIATRV